MKVKAFAYIGLNSTDLPGWKRHATGVLGMQLVEDGAQQCKFRMDDKHHRVTVCQSAVNEVAFYGWEVGSAEGLRQLCGKMSGLGYQVEPASAEETRDRAVHGLVHLRDPGGNRVELFYGHSSGHPFAPGREMRGFCIEDMGIGHAAVMTTAFEESLRFYRALGLRLSDILEMGTVYGHFFRCNAREHSMALLPGPHDGLHHLMLEVNELHDVGRALDICHDTGVKVTMSIGQHVNDLVVSFYHQTPSGFDIEYGCNGLRISEAEDARWTVRDYRDISLWGHYGPIRG